LNVMNTLSQHGHGKLVQDILKLGYNFEWISSGNVSRVREIDRARHCQGYVIWYMYVDLHET